ncbi:hypothetical protein HY772_07230 [Candidatus Woesearchaeota archaeon]|nr:hypothetical protein [Candidatus Woesearchaeota archaeon]
MNQKRDPAAYLAEWLERYLKNRDLAFRKINAIKMEGNFVKVESKDKNTTYIIVPFVEDFESALSPVLSEPHKGIAVFNTAKNLAALLRAWNKLSSIDNLIIYFVNPFSNQDKKWIINPKTHHLISDEENLKEGINAMFLTVDETSEEEVRRFVNEEAGRV